MNKKFSSDIVPAHVYTPGLEVEPTKPESPKPSRLALGSVALMAVVGSLLIADAAVDQDRHQQEHVEQRSLIGE